MSKLAVQVLIGLWVLHLGCGMGLAATLDEARTAFHKAEFQEVLRMLQSAPQPGVEEALLLGKSQYFLGRFAEAQKSFERALQAGGDGAEVRNWMGRALGMQAEGAGPFSAMGLARKTREQFQKAVELNPRHLEAVSDLFSFYLAAPGFLGGGLDKARELAETVRSLDAAEYAGLRAQIAEKEKDYGGAEQWLRRAVEAAPRSIGRQVDLARFYTRREVFAKADAALAAAKSLQPDAARLLFDEASLLVRQDRELARARQLLTQYTQARRSATDPSPYLVAQLRARLDRQEKAAAERRKR
ncbi:MAG: hypothetical protein MUF01_15495 [Bryobacterales bacterium]|jgi:tetratricopeptide (TPR) repeat protein|nr:hypothetical protein [Bryobacterales bacterium]